MSSFPDLHTDLWKSIQALPKIELHAHLFGSIKRKTLIQFHKQKHEQSAEFYLNFEAGDKVDLDTAFNYFNFVYQVIDTLEMVKTIVKEVLLDFRKENVVYIELRTTLKNIPEKGITYESYAQVLCEAAEWAENNLNMKVRYLLSADRQKIIDETSGKILLNDMALIYKKFPKYMVGIDIAGNPKKGDLMPILPKIREVFNITRETKLTIHTAEVADRDKETDAILKIKPERIGHGCYLTQEQLSQVIANNTTIEICPTSNMGTMGLKDLKQHPFGNFYRNHQYHNLCICTDDIGLFETSLTNELYKISLAFDLDLNELKNLQLSALSSSFCSEETKREIFEAYFS